MPKSVTETGPPFDFRGTGSRPPIGSRRKPVLECGPLKTVEWGHVMSLDPLHTFRSSRWSNATAYIDIELLAWLYPCKELNQPATDMGVTADGPSQQPLQRAAPPPYGASHGLSGAPSGLWSWFRRWLRGPTDDGGACLLRSIPGLMPCRLPRPPSSRTNDFARLS